MNPSSPRDRCSGLVALAAVVVGLFPSAPHAENERSGALAEAVQSHRAQAAYGAALDSARVQFDVLRADSSSAAWELADAERLLDTLGKAAALPAADQRELAVADSLEPVVMTLYEEGHYAEAADVVRNQIEIYGRHLGKDGIDRCRCHLNLGPILNQISPSAAADSAQREALACHTRLLGPDHPDVATALNNYGSFLQAAGDFERSELALRESLARLRAVYGEEHIWVAATLNNLAAVQQDQGRLAEAEVAFRDAVAVLRVLLAPDHPYLATSINNLGRLLTWVGQYEEAEVLLREALEMRRSALGEDHPRVGTSQRDLAHLLQETERNEEAETLLRASLAALESTVGHWNTTTAHSYLSLGRLAATAGDFAAADADFRAACAIWEAVGGPDHVSLVKARDELARTAIADGRLDDARETLTACVRTFESARLRTGGSWERAAFVASPYPTLAGVLLAQGEPEAAWAANERFLGRVHADLVIAAGRSDRTEEEIARERELHLRTAALEDSLGNLRRAAAAAVDADADADLVLDGVRARLLAAEREWSALRRALAERRAPRTSEPFPRERVQATLPANAALVGWLDAPVGPSAHASWAWVLRSSGPVQWTRLDSTDDGLADRVAQLRASLARPGLWGAGQVAAARAVYEQRVAPIVRQLGEITDLVVVPSGAMVGLPLEVLPDEAGRPLVDRFRISYAPSPTLFAWTRAESSERTASPTGVLLVGAPDSAVPLPGARTELEALATRWSHADLMLGGDATESRLTALAEQGALSRYRILHFATHALVDEEDPEASALQLGPVEAAQTLATLTGGGRLYDGRVTAGEIVAEWQLEADLVVLSACRSGLGRRVAGEGYAGFSGAFLQAGARSLLASLWGVPDQATARLMGRFYELWDDAGTGTGARTKVQALAEAKRWLRNFQDEDGSRPWAHPYYWSAFVLSGDPG